MTVLDFINQSVYYVIILSALTGAYFYFKSGNRTILWILVVIVMALVAESFGKLTKYLDAGYNNNWFYNLAGVLDFLIISYIYFRDKTVGLHQSIIKMFVAGALIFFFIEGLFFSAYPFRSFLNFGFSLTSIIISIYSLTYLWKLLRSEKIIIFSELPLFWASIGLLFYSICTLPLTVFINKLELIDPNNNLFTIQAVSSLILYSCYIIGFIWNKRRQQ